MSAATTVSIAAEPLPGAVTTDYFGISITDPYRALEDLDAPATKSWVDRQASATRDRLRSLPGRDALLAEYRAIDAGQRPAITALQASSPHAVFYLQRPSGGNGNRLYVRDGEAPGRPLADAVVQFAPSPDGRRVLVVTTRPEAGGAADLSVVDLASGTTTRIVDDAWNGAQPRWMPDGLGFYVVAIAQGRLQVRTERFDEGAMRTLTGWETAYTVGDNVMVMPSDDGRLLFVGILDRAERTWRVVFTRTDAAPPTWTPLIDAGAKVSAIAINGSQVFARTMAEDTLGRIVRYDARAATRAPVDVARGWDQGVLQDLVAAADGLYFSMRTGYEMALFKVPYADRSPRPTKVVLPYGGTIKSLTGSSSLDGVVFGLEGWTRAVTFFQIRADRAEVLALQEPAGAIGNDWVSEDLTCRSTDGVDIPMVAIHRKDLRHDGKHALILNGYGGYGFVEPAYFYAKSEPWIRRGGVFVDVLERGSGATGEDWHRAGMGATKSNSWNDLIACAETLIDRGYTTPDRLVVQGTGIGGLMVGRAATERPDLFAAAVIRWGITDALRFIESPAHQPADERELGRADSAAGVRQLLDASVDAHLRDEVRYPAVLLTAGLKDQRFPPWMAFKTAARWAATRTTPDRAPLLRVDYEGGATLPMTTDQRNDELADRISFMLWRTGDPDFRPRP